MTNYERMAAEIKRELAMQECCREELDKSARRVIELRKKLVDAYPQFLDTCYKDRPNKFIKIEKFPTTEEVRSFYQYGNITKDNIPLHEYGWFDIKELVAIIKVLFSLKRQKEYQILSFANLETQYKGPELFDTELVPFMNFIIGDNKSISFLETYNGRYFTDETMKDDIFKTFKNVSYSNRVRITQRGQVNGCGLGINFEYYDEHCDEFLRYFDDISKKIGFSSKYNIFDKYYGEVVRRLDKNPRRNIGSLLSFNLGIQDNFIAKALFSIVIYKKKMGKYNLDNNDYNYIFYELFKENVDLSEVVDKEIPKTLVRGK